MANHDLSGARAFAVVSDVAASWEGHATAAPAPDSQAPGLILHAAGPTDDGIRTIDVWESEAAWNCHRQALADHDHLVGLAQPPVLRQWHVRELMHPEPDDGNSEPAVAIDMDKTPNAPPREERK